MTHLPALQSDLVDHGSAAGAFSWCETVPLIVYLLSRDFMIASQMIYLTDANKDLQNGMTS